MSYLLAGQLSSMEEVIIDSFMEDIPMLPDLTICPLSTFEEELSNLSVPSSDVGIEATDLGSLLEQFEEVSETLDGDPLFLDPLFDSVVPEMEKPVTNRNASLERKELTEEVIQKIKSVTKQKTAVMLPLAVPAKRGRGRAMTRGHPVALPDHCTPRSLLKVMSQHQDLTSNLPVLATDTSSLPVLATDTEKVTKVKKKDDTAVLDENYFELIIDHDYTRTGTSVPIACEQDSSNTGDNQIKGASEDASKGAEDVSKGEVNASKDVEDVSNTEETNSIVSEEKSVSIKQDGEESAVCDESVVKFDLEDGEIMEDDHSDQTKTDKTDGLRRTVPDDTQDRQFFDKLPSYFTALSIPRKSTKKTASHVTGRGGISVHDYIERDVSPVRDTSGYNKIPDYYSSFTNSTRYDNMSSSSLEEKDSSGYCSAANLSPSRRSHSPASERSRSRSCSRSRSRHSHSRSSCRTSRRDMRSSYSPYSRCSSSSRSCSRSSCSRCSSRSSSCSSSSSCSTCDSRSSSCSRSPSRSPDRAWEREARFRGERSKRRQRSRSRSYSRHRDRSYSPASYRSRSGSRSPARRSPLQEYRERRREEKKVEREVEKEQQMKERRIVYVGGLPNKYTRHQLRSTFGRFGEIEHVQLHFREHGDNYGFVTFAFTCDAYAAIEKGNSVPGLEKFDLCFGGRRQFCDVEYADLDGNKEVEEEFESKPQKGGAFDFDELLRQARQKLKK